MVAGGLLAVWLLLRGSDVLVLPSLALGALVKLPIVAIGPLLFVAQWRRSKVAVIEGFWLAVVFAVVVYRPFWDGPATLTALRRTDLFTASLGSVLRLALAPGVGLTEAATIARWVSLGAFGSVVVVTLVLALRSQSPRTLLTLAYVTMLGAVLLATTWFQAWYVVWPFAFGAAIPCARRHLEVALLSLGGFLQYLVFIYLWVIGVFPPQETLGLQAAAYAGIVGPLVLVTVFGYARRTMHSKDLARAN
jgi:hypothetical protein